ncbi:MAG: hypothetical protein EP349_06900 [Alphaproteobacteria bacterium]|nr:MAG: hypothetical protein EP349_06900 [Alphaproteobacteria bacterium]
MTLWKKYIGVFAVLSFLMTGFSGISHASIVCQDAKSTAEAVTEQDRQAEADCDGIGTVIRKAEETKNKCCEIFCDGMGCGKMPLVAPSEMTDFKTPSLSGYEVFDLTSNGTRLERLMRPPIFR